MTFEPLTYSDFPYLKAFEPPNWGDLIPRFKYCIDSLFCNPIKLVVAGKMVAIGTTIMHADSAWLASIIVHPGERNNGYGHKITTKLTDSIDRNKFSTIYLDATDMGYPVYNKIGFELETSYAHLKSEKNISGLKLSPEVISYTEKFLPQILALDKNISCEDRTNTIKENLITARVFINNNIVQGFYLPSLEMALSLLKMRMQGLNW